MNKIRYKTMPPCGSKNTVYLKLPYFEIKMVIKYLMRKKIQKITVF